MFSLLLGHHLLLVARLFLYSVLHHEFAFSCVTALLLISLLFLLLLEAFAGELFSPSLFSELILPFFFGGLLSNFLRAALIFQHGLDFFLLFLLHAFNLFALLLDGGLELGTLLIRTGAHADVL